MYVQVQTTTVQPLIVGLLNGKKLVASVAKDGSETLPVVDFGKLPVGQERVLDIKLSNCPERPELARETDVTPLPLDPFGAFVLLKFPCRLVPSQSQTISLSFQVSLLPLPVHSSSTALRKGNRPCRRRLAFNCWQKRGLREFSVSVV